MVQELSEAASTLLLEVGTQCRVIAWAKRQ
jgi:hypothetical protein